MIPIWANKHSRNKLDKKKPQRKKRMDRTYLYQTSSESLIMPAVLNECM